MACSTAPWQPAQSASSSWVSHGGAVGAAASPQDTIVELFRKYDVKREGTICRRRFLCVVRRLMPSVTDKRIEAMLSAAGIARHGPVDYAAFVSWAFGDGVPPRSTTSTRQNTQNLTMSATASSGSGAFPNVGDADAAAFGSMHRLRPPRPISAAKLPVSSIRDEKQPDVDKMARRLDEDTDGAAPAPRQTPRQVRLEEPEPFRPQSAPDGLGPASGGQPSVRNVPSQSVQTLLPQGAAPAWQTWLCMSIGQALATQQRR